MEASYGDLLYNKVAQQWESSQASIWSKGRNLWVHGKNGKLFKLITLKESIKAGFGYLIDISTHHNNLNLPLQHKDMLVHNLFDQVKAFKIMLYFCETLIKRGTF